jgi:uncharacterized protein HemX
MGHRMLALLAALTTLVVLALPAGAQDPSSSTTTTAAVPTQDIVPEPDSGRAPTDAGDRGGALQLGLLALVVVVLGGAVVGLVRQSRGQRES